MPGAHAVGELLGGKWHANMNKKCTSEFKFVKLLSNYDKIESKEEGQVRIS